MESPIYLCTKPSSRTFYPTGWVKISFSDCGVASDRGLNLYQEQRWYSPSWSIL